MYRRDVSGQARAKQNVGLTFICVSTISTAFGGSLCLSGHDDLGEDKIKIEIDRYRGTEENHLGYCHDI